jgi:hypothetical protein
VLLAGLIASSIGVHAGGAANVFTGFDPLSVSFPAPKTGWALGTARCSTAGRCLTLRRTTNGGKSWSTRKLPVALTAMADRKVGGDDAFLYPGGGLNVHFSDLRNGWIYGDIAVKGSNGPIGQPILWSTHNGGRAWHQQILSWFNTGNEILDLESSNGHVHLITFIDRPGVGVASSPVSHDHWRISSNVKLGLPAGGSELMGSITLSGPAGWLIEGNDRGTTGAAQLKKTRWVAWTPPCAFLGGSYAPPAASTPKNLVAACVMGGFASPLPKNAPKGAKVGSTWLYFSTDGGRHFRHGPELGPNGVFFGDVIASPHPGVVLITRLKGRSQTLRASFDGGKHWRTVVRGNVVSLAFTNATQGVGIVERGKLPNRLIMTTDGGKHFRVVRI